MIISGSEEQDSAEASDDLVIDEAESEEHSHKRFQITSYGADMTVFELTHRLGKELIIPPAFQRKYVWSQRQASRFVESLLMGLPIPGIFLFKDQKLKKQLLVDGLQRLETLARFKAKHFQSKLFKLIDVAEPWEGKTWDELSAEDKDVIEQSVIHATIFQQDFPKEKDRSIYEVFERINTGGMRLSSQEIRACISFGDFSALLRDLNKLPEWRSIFGKYSQRLKDEELVLRFLALLHRGTEYKKPLRDFLDDFLEYNRNLDQIPAETLQTEFTETIKCIHTAIGEKAFRAGTSLNAAIFDSVMIGVARRLKKGPILNGAELKQRYVELMESEAYRSAYERATSDDESVKRRIELSTEYFSKVS